jgi:antitoxin ParD1/3/4
MAEGVNVRLTGPLRQFIEERSGPKGLYESASEYIRDLVRQDFELNEQKKWDRLVAQLTPGMNADESEFVAFDPEQLIAEARSEKAADAS